MAETTSTLALRHCLLRTAPIGVAAAGTLALLLAAPASSVAQVAPGGLGTRVNGTALGRCNAGVCTVEGGTAAGRTLFHRFSQYDTRSGIRRVDLDSRGRSNVVVGVSHPDGSFFGAPLRLSGNANLFWLSPGGLWFGPGGQIQGATSLLLSTAPSLRIGGETFQAAGGLGDRLGSFGQGAALDLEALAAGRLEGTALASGDGPILLAGGRLSVDRHLLLHSGAGPIRTSPDSQTALQAGRSVQLSGGTLQLNGLDIQAGTSAADDLVRLRSGPLMGGGLGHLSLRDASLRGTRVLLEGSGGLELERVAARAGGAVEPGEVQISAGTATTTGAARLQEVSLAGGEIVLRASGSLSAVELRAEAGKVGGEGILRLEAGGPDDTTSSLKLERAELYGRSVVAHAAGVSELRRVNATASGGTGQGELWLGAGADGSEGTSPMLLQGVTLQGGDVTIKANGNLTAETLQIQANRLGLQAEAVNGKASLHLVDARLAAPVVSAEASGDLTASHLQVSSDTIQLRSGNRLTLANGTSLRAEAPQGLIELMALSPSDSNPKGQLDLEDTNLKAPTIIGLADRSVSLRSSSATAGEAGQRGLIQLETAPVADLATDPGIATSATAHLTGTTLTGQRVTVRSDNVWVRDTRIATPKGQIHLEAKTGSLDLSGSNLDLGVRAMADLESPVNVRENIQGTSIDISAPTPSIGLFAANELTVRDGSQILGSQDLTMLRRLEGGLAREQIRLTDTSAVVVLDAGHGLNIRDSRIEANASDNLAGVLLLRSRAEAGSGELNMINSSLEASGGAGSGDIRLMSNHGILIENSQLSAQSTRSPEDPEAPGQANWGYPISGGEISLTNSSEQRPITIRNSQLSAEQSGTGALVRLTVLDGSDESSGPLLLKDQFDDSDSGTVGGIVNLISAGSMEFSGTGTRISVNSLAPNSEVLESFGGTIRVVNLSGKPIEWGGLQPFQTRAADPLDALRVARSGDLILVASSLEPPPSTGIWGAGRSENPYLLQPGKEREDQIFTGGSYGYPGGLPQEIRDRLNPPQPDVVFVPEQPPIALPLPPLQPQLRTFPDKNGTGPEMRSQTSNGKRENWTPWPAASLAILPSTPISLIPGAAETTSQAGSATLTSSSQPLSKDVAVQTLQARDEASVQWIQAALRQSLPAPRDLEVASLQRVLQQASRNSADGREHQPVAMGPGISSTTTAQAHLYTPAILQISSTTIPGEDLIQINQILVPATGDIKGWQSRIPLAQWQRALEGFRKPLSQGDGWSSLKAGRMLSSVLLDPILPELERQGITALLLAPDRGLQSVPFAALPWGNGVWIDHLAITITPALSLTNLDTGPSTASEGHALLAGSSRFSNGLAPLPMAAQELQALAALHPGARMLLNEAFRTNSLLEEIETSRVAILHLATHADFTIDFIAKGDLAEKGRIYTSDGELSLASLSRELRRKGRPAIGLFVLNGCRTAMGDEDQELGISGLALQANATSAVGNLWYIDDVVTAAFSIQFHRALQKGLSKDQALQQTQLLFRQGKILIRDGAIVTDHGEILIRDLSRADQARLEGRLADPYYWAGTILSGRPW